MAGNAQQLMMQKADKKMKDDLLTLNNAFNMMNVKGLPDQKKVEIYNNTLVPVSNRMNPKSKLTAITEWPQHGNDFAKRLSALAGSHKKGDLSSKDYLDSLNLISAEAGAAGQTINISGLAAGAQRGRRQERLGLTGAGTAGPETPLAAEIPTEIGRERYVETGEFPKAAGAGRAGGTGVGGGKEFGNAKDLRKEYLGLTADYRKIRDAYARVQESAKNPSPAGDLALIFNYMKMLDPGSVVRESEFRTAEQAKAWLSKTEGSGITVPSAVQTAIQKAGVGTFLLPDQRRDFANRSKSFYIRQGKQHDKNKKEYTRIAKSFDLRPETVIVDLGDPEVEAMMEAEASAQPPAQGDNTVTVKNPQTGEEEVWDLTTEQRVR
jgi:hypothetical protein